MANGRLNPVIERLTAGEAVVSTPPIANGNWEMAQELGDSDYDMVIFEMEHFGFDFMGLRTSLHAMLNRRRIHEDGLRPSVVPATRVPPNARETSQWIIKQALDQGVYGFVAPQVQTAEEALAIVKAARYPARRGNTTGGGERGYFPFLAARYWGLSPVEYVEKADVWPVNPDGELVIMAIIESRLGVENIERILDATTGLGIIWPAPGDMSTDMGVHLSNPLHPEVQENILRVLDVCRERGVACASIASDTDDALKRLEEGFQVILTRFQPGMAAAVHAHRALPRPSA